MKHQLEALIAGVLQTLRDDGSLSLDLVPDIRVERSRDPRHGDFACNIAMLMAKPARRQPRELAELICAGLLGSDRVQRVEVAGPGFINFFMTPGAFQAVVGEILQLGESFGCSNRGQGRSVLVEFVSANPTGPLHVGHGRGAAYGAAVADLLTAVGFTVHREYYINDAGRQMDILTASIWLRYLELCGEEVVFPSNGYKGDYIIDIAADLHRVHGDALRRTAGQIMRDLPPDFRPGGEGDKEAHIDAIVARAKQLLGEADYRVVLEAGLVTILRDIREDLTEFGIVYEKWFSERGLMESGALDRAVERLKAGGHLYDKQGALWFRSTDYSDEKDRVIVRENGQTTYFASDIAYHIDKLERGYERIIDVWGADHHGYVPRVKAVLEALGDDPAKLDVLLVQFAVLYRSGEKVPMSTRSGEFVTLRELRHEVGNDAARFFYVMRKCEQHMDFDLDLAKAQTNENPVFYIQYAHARICSVMRQMGEKGLSYKQVDGCDNLHLLTERHEQDLLLMLSRFPEVVEAAALTYEPHQIPYYLRDLANAFHTYYNAHQFLVAQNELRNARLALIFATRQVLANGLGLIGVSAPEAM